MSSDDYVHVLAALLYSIFRFASVCNKTNLYQVTFTKQASNENEINGSGQKKPKVMRQQTKKNCYGHTVHGFLSVFLMWGKQLAELRYFHAR
jgi:hypothetical protein